MKEEVEQPREMDRIDSWVLRIKESVYDPKRETSDREDLRSALISFQQEIFGDLEEACKKYHEVMSYRDRQELLEKIDQHFKDEWCEMGCHIHYREDIKSLIEKDKEDK